MKIQLIDYNREMGAAYKEAFKDIPDVEVHTNSAFAITKYLGQQVQNNVQKLIKEYYNGELLVGQALFVATENPLVPYCISAPTMRVPMYLGQDSINAYLAARAIFLLLKQPVPFKTVTIPGLGTGVGAVPYDVCAKQVRKAYDDFYVGNGSEFPKTWHQAQFQHQMLFKKSSNETTDIQFK